jgi:two-component system chemotaxis sensor kinase CheA
MNPLLQQFVTESQDILERMSKSLLALECNPDDDAVVDELFRAVHTLKGNSGLFDIPTFTRVVHAAEDLLDKVRDKELPVDTDLTDELLDSMDFIQRMVEMVEATGTIPGDFADEAESRIERLKARMPEDSFGGFFDEEPVDQVMPPETMDWLALVPEADRLKACEMAQEAALVAIRYLPEPECFFKGEDPLLLLRNMPGRQAFRLEILEPYEGGGDIDIYRANLGMHALSTATAEELKDHFRYVSEQVAIYSLPASTLAIPQGIDGCEEGLRDEFVAQAENLLKDSDAHLLAEAAEAMLDMLNPALKAASALRWIRQLALAGASASALSALVRSFETGEPPEATEALAPAEDVTERAEERVVPSPAPVPAFRLDVRKNPLVVRIVTTQRQLLDIPVPDDQWDGRLRAIGNTLKALVQAEAGPSTVSGFDAVLASCSAERSFLPLAFHLEEILADSEDEEDEEATLAVAPAAVASIETAAKVVAEDPAADAGRAAPETAEKGARVLKVPQEKIDRLMDLIGEMVVAKNALPYLATKAEEVFGSRELSREIKAQFAVINRIAEDMQDGIMQVRMLPMSSVFQRFPRLVRDVSRQLGKRVKLVLEGEEAEADKHIVESLGDPLIHILRNSLDHGLEMPEVRRAAGKTEEGRIVVRATQEGDRVLIEIEDDGKGIDPAVIKRKAFEKGLIDESRLEAISDADAVQLVFAAGFSTAETVSNLSGRGVGMDVVKNSLEKIGGQVRLTSEKGRGTRILLTLPLSVAVSNVLMVRMNGQRYGVPIDVVVETVRVPCSEIHVIKDRRVAVLRGRIVPLFGADELLQLPEPPSVNTDGEHAVLVAKVGGTTMGLIVDGFAQTTDVILKPLEGPLAGLPGFAGSALLGDGSVLLVLDLKELMHAA